MKYKDILSFSWGNIKSNRLRTAITVIIIALGIFALILIITAIRAASNSLTSSFSTMGANSFSIRHRDRFIRFSSGRSEPEKTNSRKLVEKRSNINIPISLEEARMFKSRYEFPGARVSIGMRGPSSVVVNAGSNKTNPDIRVVGGDENYLEVQGFKVLYGRNLSPPEVESGASICVLGYAVAKTLYPDNPEKALEKTVYVDHKPFRVIGILEEGNSSVFFNTGKQVIMPYNSVRRSFAVNPLYSLGVMISDIKLMDYATAEAEGVFRPIRGLEVKEESNFAIDKSDSIAQALLTNLSFLEIGTIGIAFITLIGAAIGLMNIMLVAVNERTKEIGLAKALGGTKKSIRTQFLFESVMISLLGALLGIVSGVLVGNIVALLLKTGFVLPWNWVLAGIMVCTLVGLAAGLYPAMKASRLNPITALRYE